MNSHDKQQLEAIIEGDILKETGIMACVTIRRDYRTSVPYEEITILHSPKEGNEFEKQVHLRCETIYQNTFHDIADHIIEHLGFPRLAKK